MVSVAPTASANVGEAMYRLAVELYPICRSITGNGVRESLKILQRHVPLELREVPSGTPVLDWTVPNEWNIRDAYIKNAAGERVVDFRRCNLHVVSYSIPIRARLRLAELRPHLHSLPDHPDWVPYRTSYYKEEWGFCLSHKKLLALRDEEYDVCVDSTLMPGHLTYGECVISGSTTEEVLISCHVCHPSLANDNLSGMALATMLAQYVAQEPRRYTYRFVFIPGTIGSIAWLARNEERIGRIRHGLVVTCVGDGGRFTYKKSRGGNTGIDRAAIHVLKHLGDPYALQEFFPYGYDERQYCSPGFDLPVGCLMRSPHGTFPEYHTSADNLDLVQPAHLERSLTAYCKIVDVLEGDGTFLNLFPKGEPQLGRRGLYNAIGGSNHDSLRQMAMLWVLNLSDGMHSLLDIAERAGTEFGMIHEVARQLAQAGVLQQQSSPRE